MCTSGTSRAIRSSTRTARAAAPSRSNGTDSTSRAGTSTRTTSARSVATNSRSSAGSNGRRRRTGTTACCTTAELTRHANIRWTIRPCGQAAPRGPDPPRGPGRCVLASLDLRAQALYVKFGMLPRTTLYYVDGKPTKSTVGGVELRQLGPAGISTQRARDLAARFDRRLREARRDADQRYFVTIAKGSRFYEARADGQTVGYVVVRGNGAIGPGGVHDPSLSAGLMSAAIAKAHENGMKTVSAWVPGLNGGALMAAFGAGLKVEFLTAWMAAEDILRLDSYVPSGGVLF